MEIQGNLDNEGSGYHDVANIPLMGRGSFMSRGG